MRINSRISPPFQILFPIIITILFAPHIHIFLWVETVNVVCQVNAIVDYEHSAWPNSRSIPLIRLTKYQSQHRFIRKRFEPTWYEEHIIHQKQKSATWKQIKCHETRIGSTCGHLACSHHVRSGYLATICQGRPCHVFML